MAGGNLTQLATLLRYYILISSTQAGSGHPTSSLSAVELMTVLFFKYLRYDLDNPKFGGNDRVIFSKGHASPLLYALYTAAGKITESELLKYRTFNSVLEGHPSMRFPYTEVPTGSLGQGLGVGVGEALALRAMTNDKFQMTNGELTTAIPRVYILLGDGEIAEGSTWEAAGWAAQQKLGNLVAIADVNRLGQSEDTMLGYDVHIYKKRFEVFGWHTIVVDGHSIDEVDRAYSAALHHTGVPTIILAKTVKGKGVSFLEGVNGWHGKALSKEELEKALKELGKVDTNIRATVQKPVSVVIPGSTRNPSSSNAGSRLGGRDDKIEYDPTKPVATRKAFGNALKRLGAVMPKLVVLDGDVKNSTFTDNFEKAYPDRFFQMYIAEQLLVGAATGLAARGFQAVAATFACFLSRAHDQIRMAGLSQLPLLICGSHAGVSIGEDGPSQMALEDLAMFRALPNSVVLYPSDAWSAERLTEEALKRTSGITYIRTSRPATPILYSEKEKFPIGGSKEIRIKNSKFLPRRQAGTIHDAATIIAAGITLHEALKAQEKLAKERIGVRVIDCYSVKPIDEKAIRKAALETKAIIIVEDHYPEGGLGEAVLSALTPLKDSPLKVVHLAVRKFPRSGKGEELLNYEGIDAGAIIKAVKSVFA